MPKTKLVIFDFDGVLVDTLTMACDAYNHFFREIDILKKINSGNELSKEQFQELFETDWRGAMEKIGVTGEKLVRCTEIYSQFVDKYSDKSITFSGIKEMLTQIKAEGYKMAIASNNVSERVIERLKHEGLMDYFDEIIDERYGLKPDPAGILVLLAKLNIKPEEAVMVGDMDGDILAAKNANLKKAIAVSWGYHHPRKLQHADVIINSPEKLFGVIE